MYSVYDELTCYIVYEGGTTRARRTSYSTVTSCCSVVIVVALLWLLLVHYDRWGGGRGCIIHVTNLPGVMD